MKYDILISVNVHENPEYLLSQIQNINEYVSLRKKIILNCNDFMIEQLKGKTLPDVDINPKPLSKQRYHGSLTCGIFRNMLYGLQNYYFDYFLVMSSREFFYRELKSIQQIEENINDKIFKDYSLNDWHWPIFKNTKLYQYLQKNNLYYSASAHEGMCYSRDSCQYIVDFLNKFSDISEDLFNFGWCVEEFAIQSICVNFSNYYYIGNGCETENINNVDPKKFTHKRIR